MWAARFDGVILAMSLNRRPVLFLASRPGGGRQLKSDMCEVLLGASVSFFCRELDPPLRTGGTSGFTFDLPYENTKYAKYTKYIKFTKYTKYELWEFDT